MTKIQNKMSDKVKIVDAYDTLMQHREEYEYYRTDHHWTTLGAYYAYTDFCKAKGIEPEELDSYDTKKFDGFLGSASTLMACEQMDRICYGVELEPKFVDVAVNRYIEFRNGDSMDVYVIREGEKISYEDAVKGLEDADGTTE